MEVNFDDPTENIVVPYPGYYTVIVHESFDTFSYHHVYSLQEVHAIIRATSDYKFHRQKLSEPYTYNIVTNQFFRDVRGTRLF